MLSLPYYDDPTYSARLFLPLALFHQTFHVAFLSAPFHQLLPIPPYAQPYFLLLLTILPIFPFRLPFSPSAPSTLPISFPQPLTSPSPAPPTPALPIPFSQLATFIPIPSRPILRRGAEPIRLPSPLVSAIQPISGTCGICPLVTPPSIIPPVCSVAKGGGDTPGGGAWTGRGRAGCWG